jgi:hypothetical protein
MVLDKLITEEDERRVKDVETNKRYSLIRVLGKEAPITHYCLVNHTSEDLEVSLDLISNYGKLNRFYYSPCSGIAE